jgi:hypothetical protein
VDFSARISVDPTVAEATTITAIAPAAPIATIRRYFGSNAAARATEAAPKMAAGKGRHRRHSRKLGLAKPPQFI